MPPFHALVAAVTATAALATAVVPGAVTPAYPQSWQMNQSTAIMICNNSGRVDPQWAAQWSLVDLDWNGNKINWSKTAPMSAEEDMYQNMRDVKDESCRRGRCSVTWVYRNGIKALPWHTTVRKRLEDPRYWGWFMPLANCSPSPGVYVCGENATANLYHDFEQTPTGDCGVGVRCGEYVFNHRNTSLLTDFLLLNATDGYFFGSTGLGSTVVDGFYIDDDWSAAGPSEMDADAVAKMGMSKADVAAMTAAWAANQAAWRDAFVAAGKFEWFLFLGGQQGAPGTNQTDPAQTCAKYLTAFCGADSPSQTGTLFYGFSRITHHQAWFPNGTLPYAEQDTALFALARGPYAYIGYGWTGCADAAHPFTRPASLDWDLGPPAGFCAETAPGSNVWARTFERAVVSVNCTSFESDVQWT